MPAANKQSSSSSSREVGQQLQSLEAATKRGESAGLSSSNKKQRNLRTDESDEETEMLVLQ